VSTNTQYLYDVFMRDAWNATAQNRSLWPEEARAWTDIAARFVTNQTEAYYSYLSAPTAIFSFGTIRPRGAAATLASVAAPLLLWSALTVFTAGVFRGRGKSTVSVWLLSAAVCHIWWRGVTLPLIAVIVVVKLALVFFILTDEMKRQPIENEVDDILEDLESDHPDTAAACSTQPDNAT
jgi:hypothetical protein